MCFNWKQTKQIQLFSRGIFNSMLWEEGDGNLVSSFQTKLIDINQLKIQHDQSSLVYFCRGTIVALCIFSAYNVLNQNSAFLRNPCMHHPHEGR